jgi:hypothetical protein
MFRVGCLIGFILLQTFGGRENTQAEQQKVIESQWALPLRPEFKGSVTTVETRDFWGPQDQFCGNNQAIHWNGNGES